MDESVYSRDFRAAPAASITKAEPNAILTLRRFEGTVAAMREKQRAAMRKSMDATRLWFFTIFISDSPHR